MATASRDEQGHWTLTAEDGDYPVFNDWLGRHLNALDPIFEKARETCEFEFILCLLRVYGMQDGGWDPWETTIRAIPRISELAAAADAETRKHLTLWMYGHVYEASEPYELLANLIRVGTGGRYQITSAFPPRGNRPTSPGEKIQELQTRATEAGFPNAFVPLREAWDRTLRNSAFHADYTVRTEGLRILNPMRQYSWEEYDRLVNGALAYHTAFFKVI